MASMKKEEIVSFLAIGTSKSVCVDRSLLPELPGVVREITIQQRPTVKLEYNIHGQDEGGVCHSIEFENLNRLIEALEEFLGEKLDHWENHSKTGRYPMIDPSFDLLNAGQLLTEAVTTNALEMPDAGTKYCVQPGYWKDLSESAKYK